MNPSLIQNQNAYLSELAVDTLAKLEKVAEEAAVRLSSSPGVSISAIANADSSNSEAIGAVLGTVNRELLENYRQLRAEPAVARVVTQDQNDQQHTYFICRSGGGIQGLVGRNAPLGRLASLDIDDSLPWHGTTHTVVEKARLWPRKLDSAWDSMDSVIETEDLGPITVTSLRAFLVRSFGEATDLDLEDLVSQILSKGQAEQQVFQGLRRSVLEKMGFRDQPVLDKFQDEIFRLPLNHQLILLGPPGTGKTTTLIRRLGQKVNWDVLTEDERDIVNATSHPDPLGHANSWLMFTPTDLLKQYLKEAFAREGVPAPDWRIKTWSQHRLDLARNHFGILKNGEGRGVFTLRESSTILQGECTIESTRWFEDFESWFHEQVLNELWSIQREMARVILPSHPELRRPLAAKELAKRLENLLTGRTHRDVNNLVEALIIGESSRIEQLVDELKPVADSGIRATVNRMISRDRGLLSELADYLLAEKAASEPTAEDTDDPVTEDDETSSVSADALQAALLALMGAIRTKVRLGAQQPPRVPSKSSRSGKILAWVGERVPLEIDEVFLGPVLQALALARFIQRPLNRLLDGIPKRYRIFRRDRQKTGLWYQPSGFDSRDLHPLEIDLLLLAMLREGNQLLQRSHIQSSLHKDSTWAPLETLAAQHHNQILVDEATDFSPLQLGCMAALSHPRSRSFFACGDFNQRLTTWGARNEEALRWAVPNIDQRTIRVAYRQSRQLNEFAQALVAVFGSGQGVAELPRHLKAEGVQPALLESANESEVVAWLSDRIQDIERFLGRMPSTAVFVNSEREVAPLAQLLKDSLSEYNLRAVACHQGQALGEDSDIRVFDVQHIKGLEFESVFFVGIDHLTESHPDLFDKYLYVGTTRAATYLGLTCTGSLPKVLEPLRSHFVSNWQQNSLPHSDNERP
jgi:hypothetical protein